MANNFGLGFVFTATDKVSGPAGRIAGANDRIAESARRAGASTTALEAGLAKLGKRRDANGRFLPKGGPLTGGGGGRDSKGRFLPGGGGGGGGGGSPLDDGLAKIRLDSFNAFNTALTTNRDALTRGAAATAQARARVLDLAASVERNRDAQARLRAEILLGGDADKKKRTQLAALTAATGLMSRELAKAQAALKQTTDKTSLTRLAFNALGVAAGNLASGAVTKGFQALTGSITGSAMASIDFESAMADVNKVLPEGTELKPISDGAKQLAKDIGLAPTQVAALTASLAQSGIAGDELTLVAGDASRLAVAFGISGEEGGQALAKLRTGLGLTRPEVNSLTGTINELSNRFAATAPELVDAVQRVGSVAKAANISAEAAAGLATAMIASGASAEVAATGTKTFLRSLGAGDAATKRQKLAFKALGLDAQDVAKRLTAGGLSAEETIKDVVSRIGQLDQEDRLPNLIRLFGSESIGAIGPLAGNVQLLGDAFKVATNKTAAQGSVLKEYETRSKTTGAAIERLKANVGVLAIEVGDRMNDAIRWGIDLLNRWIDKLREFGNYLSTLDGPIGGLKAGLDSLRLVYEGLVQAFSAGAFSGAVRKEMNLAENAGIKKFVIRVYMLFARLRVFFEGVADGFAKGWEVVGPKVTAVFENLKKVFWTVLGVFGAAGDEVATSSMNSWRVWGDGLGQSIADVMNWIVSLVGFFAGLLAENEWLVKSLMFSYAAFKAVKVGIWLATAAAVVSKKIMVAYAAAARFMGGAMKVAAVGMKVFRLAIMGITVVMKALRLVVIRNPIGALITGLVIGAYLIYKYWEPISGFFTGLWESVTSAFKTALDWILDKIDWIGERIEDFKFAVTVTPEEQAAMEAAGEAETAKLKAGSSLFADDLDRQTSAPRTDALARAQAEAAQAASMSIVDKVKAQAQQGVAQAQAVGQTFAQRLAAEREMANANAATGGGNVSVNLTVDGQVLARAVAQAGKNNKARTFSSVDPRDDDE